jgi:hypothetical protein
MECRQSFVMKPSNKYDAHNIKALRYHKASCKFCWLTRILIQEFDEPISRKHSIIFYYSQTCWARAVNVKLSLLGVLSETDCCLTWEPRTIWWVYESSRVNLLCFMSHSLLLSSELFCLNPARIIVGWVLASCFWVLAKNAYWHFINVLQFIINNNLEAQFWIISFKRHPQTVSLTWLAGINHIDTTANTQDWWAMKFWNAESALCPHNNIFS